MSREIKYKAIESYGDHTAKFEIQGVEGMKVREFISYIINERPEDSGTFSIDGLRYPYDNKRRLLSINTDQAPCHLTIASVTAHGAYRQMDYEISTKNTTKPTMSRETIFRDGASVGGYEFSSATQLTEDIAKKEADISYYKERLLALAMATPKDITPDGSDPLEHVKQMFDELWDEIQDQTIALGNMYTVQLNERYVRGEESCEKTKPGYIGPEYYDRKFR